MPDYNIPIDARYLVQPDDNPLDDIFSMRRKTLDRKIKLLEEQIQERKDNLESNLHKIDLDLCLCGTLVYQIPYHDREGENRILLTHKIPLYREKRKEQTDFLRDTATLRREIIDTTLQKLSLQDKEKLLE